MMGSVDDSSGVNIRGVALLILFFISWNTISNVHNWRVEKWADATVCLAARTIFNFPTTLSFNNK